jgi:hypothetical protein
MRLLNQLAELHSPVEVAVQLQTERSEIFA